MTDPTLLLKVIYDNPDEDVPLLMYADEIAPTDPARARLIECQVEIDAMLRRTPEIYSAGVRATSPDPATVERYGDLLDEATNIIVRHSGRWRRGAVCHECRATGRVRAERCVRCNGTGDLGGLRWWVRDGATLQRRCAQLERDGEQFTTWAHHVRYVRGMKHVTCLFRDAIDANEPDVLRPTVWLVDLVNHHPDVVQIHLDDHRPATLDGVPVWRPYPYLLAGSAVRYVNLPWLSGVAHDWNVANNHAGRELVRFARTFV